MNHHVVVMYRKCLSKLGILYKIHRFVSQETALSIFKVMVLPCLDYGDFVDNSAQITKINNLDRMHDRFLRLVKYCHSKKHRKDIVDLKLNFNLEDQKARRKRNLSRIMFTQSKLDRNVTHSNTMVMLRIVKFN